MLRWLKSYDKQQRLFLPPAELGGASTLPPEIVEAYKKAQEQSKASVQQEHTEELPLKGEQQIVSGMEATSKSAALLTGQPLAEALTQKSTAGKSTSSAPLTRDMMSSCTSVISHFSGGMHSSSADLEFWASQVETSPVAACLTRYLGIDLKQEIAMAELRKGIVFVLCGSPLSGKTTQAHNLAQIYGAVVVSVDELIINVISSASTPAGCRAREVCMEARNKPKVPSVDLKAGFQGAGASRRGRNLVSKVCQSVGSGNKELSYDALTDPPTPFIVQTLDNSQCAVPDGSLLPIVLPEDIVVEIISDRLQLPDCQKGVVFDGLDSQFTLNQHMTAALLLKAFQSRMHIYFINIHMSECEILQRVVNAEVENQRIIGRILKLGYGIEMCPNSRVF